MPEEGETQRINGKLMIWRICADCKEGKFVQAKKGKPCSERCRLCMIKRNTPRYPNDPGFVGTRTWQD